MSSKLGDSSTKMKMLITRVTEQLAHTSTADVGVLGWKKSKLTIFEQERDGRMIKSACWLLSFLRLEKCVVNLFKTWKTSGNDNADVSIAAEIRLRMLAQSTEPIVPLHKVEFEVIQGFWGDIDFEYKEAETSLRLITDDNSENVTVEISVEGHEEGTKEIVELHANHLDLVLYTDPETSHDLPPCIVVRLTSDAFKCIEEQIPEHYKKWQKLLDDGKQIFKSFSDTLIFVVHPEKITTCEAGSDIPEIERWADVGNIMDRMKKSWKKCLGKKLDWSEPYFCHNCIESIEKIDFQILFSQFGLKSMTSNIALSTNEFLRVFKCEPPESNEEDVEYEEISGDSSGDDEPVADVEEEEIKLIEAELLRQRGEEPEEEAVTHRSSFPGPPSAKKQRTE
ncbi:hypothetical protein GCK72_022133 [Caenorhabditis remanei]|uniref:Uncharacterized protein n=1 Tax=Caenorhabditis remanei TaxID=31234 RepID=A0A6A5FT69_CAERE|nr:hypothetical protein GCK72_022133 [Caenorhabditis remanei]KAF1745686.1 hypothetical protein GCK72_022133 [Caenorhabditis remanei]